VRLLLGGDTSDGTPAVVSLSTVAIPASSEWLYFLRIVCPLEVYGDAALGSWTPRDPAATPASAEADFFSRIRSVPPYDRLRTMTCTLFSGAFPASRVSSLRTTRTYRRRIPADVDATGDGLRWPRERVRAVGPSDCERAVLTLPSDRERKSLLKLMGNLEASWRRSRSTEGLARRRKSKQPVIMMMVGDGWTGEEDMEAEEGRNYMKVCRSYK